MKKKMNVLIIGTLAYAEVAQKRYNGLGHNITVKHIEGKVEPDQVQRYREEYDVVIHQAK